MDSGGTDSRPADRHRSPGIRRTPASRSRGIRNPGIPRNRAIHSRAIRSRAIRSRDIHSRAIRPSRGIRSRVHPPQPGYPQPGQPQQPYAGPPAQLTSGLYVTAEFIFLQWMLIMTGPVITVYGRPIPFKWNQPQVVPLPPGNHPINIHFPWIFQKGNSTDAVVPVHPGHATELKYSTSFFVFTSGTIAPRGFRPWGV